MIKVDLIYIEFANGNRTMSVSIISTDKNQDQMLGPVDAAGAIKELAPMLFEALPGAYQDLAQAEHYLMVVHFRNMTNGRNESGIAYPFETTNRRSKNERFAL